MTARVALSVAWILLALLTLGLLISEGRPWVVALAAWTGGIVTREIYASLRGTPPT